MMSPLGALFGLTAAFLGSAVWQNHGDAVIAANVEARSLSEAWITAGYLADPLKTQVQTGINDYIQTVSKDEWPMMRYMTTLNNPVSNRAREYLLGTVRQLVLQDRAPTSTLEGAVRDVLVRELRAAFEARSRRVDIALRRISDAQLIATLALGLSLMTLVSLVHHLSRQSQIIGVLLTSFAVAVTISSIVAHDNPFYGYLAVTSSDFAEIATYGRTANAGQVANP
jgi:hypothetical protein